MADLSNTSVFLDFDGTVTVADVGVHLLKRLATGDWHALDEDYAAGRMGSREVIDLQWHLMDGADEAEKRRVASEIDIDSGYAPLVEALQASDAEVAIVSDGWGFYIADAIGPSNVPVFSNSIDFVTNTLVSPHADPSCATCGVCGTCKPTIVREAATRGRTTIFIGDGTSDRHAARIADTVFAKGSLAQWCAAEGIPHTSFTELREVQEALFY